MGVGKPPGFTPAVRTAEINSAARQNVLHAGTKK
jgi:hypothetical protein